MTTPATALAEPVRRTFRRILSGDDDGLPPWVRAIGEPGDAGWFGPGSQTWEVHSSLATLVGGVRALLLQACHPLALAGVEEHSSYREDPLGRLQRTNMFVTTTTFGSSERAEGAARLVRSVHERVVGTAPDGRTYRAGDPRLLMWVHVGLTDSMLVAAQRYHHRPVDADAYVAEMAVTGRAVGVLEPPTTRAELSAVLDGFTGEIAGGSTAREVSTFLQHPGRALPAAALPAYAVLSRAATDLLPTWAHPVLGTPERGPTARRLDVAACRALLASLRVVLGPRSAAVEAAYRRVGVQP
ncbi:MAG TPA: oxygenase MpaB family protein [Actinomycetes bacterium]|nr:oxygenase MpaB family protein [Actinomycetes bacterium]